MNTIKQKVNNLSLAIIIVIAFGFLPTSVFASEITQDNVVKYVNEAREKEGVGKLTVSAKLTEVATRKVNDMVANKYFAHTSPAGLSPWHWFSESGYDYKYAGENLAINFTTAEAEHKAWMESPTHRKNILNPNYKEIGVAVAVGEINGYVGIITVQEFGTLARSSEVVGVENDKNFSSVESKVVPEAVKFSPAVLSFKNNAAGEEMLKNYSSANKNTIGKENGPSLQEVGAWDFSWLAFVMFVLLFLPLAVVQIVFVGRFLQLPWFESFLENKYQSAYSNHSTRKIKVIAV